MNLSVVLLHGMFGKAGNWRSCADHLSRGGWRVFTPELPIFETPARQTVVEGLVDHVSRLLDEWAVEKAVLGGNSLGGHVALQMALRDPWRIEGLVLTGSSGLFERGFERHIPRHPSREWLRAKIREVFYDGKHVTEALLDEVSATVLDSRRARQILRVAKSAKRDNLREMLHRITCPVLLAWGAEDRITPPTTALEFGENLPDAELHYIPQCGHAAMLERPDEFNRLVMGFLRERWEPVQMAHHPDC
jgi:pimeloyl-ACP methyl ester carboxylesterase